jgi:hypothetical protein
MIEKDASFVGMTMSPLQGFVISCFVKLPNYRPDGATNNSSTFYAKHL